MMSWRPVAPTAVELMRGPCGAPCAREGEHERGVACGQVFHEKFSTRSVGGDMRGGDTWALRLKSQRRRWRRCLDMILGSYLRHLALLSCV